MRIGGAGTTSIGGPQPWTNTSDGRFKFNVKENIPGLEFITKLRPVSYQLNRQKLNGFYNGTEEVSNLASYETGFIAQEVELAAKQIGYDFNGVYRPTDLSKDTYGIAYATLVVPLVKAVQEQQMNIEKQQKEIEELKSMVKQLLNSKK